MRILIVHSYYLFKGGEDNVFEQEFDLLSNDNKVFSFTRRNKSGIVGFLQFIFSFFNIYIGFCFFLKIIMCRPNIIHIHNLHFSIGPIIIIVAKLFKIPIVYTLHNYRMLCPSATLLYNGKIYLTSVNCQFPWHAILLKIYKNSFFLTFWLAFVTWFHKVVGTWALVDKYIVLTEFSKSIFISSSFPINNNNVIVKPNFTYQQFMNRQDKDYFLFVGRLSEEKGIGILLEAFIKSDFNLHIVGNGPLAYKVIDIQQHSNNIKYLGELNKKGVLKEMQHATALIFPSIWYEGMPMTIIEAFSIGLPVIASNIGAMKSMINHKYNGLHFHPNCSNSLDLILKTWNSFPVQLKHEYSINAANTYLNNYESKINYQIIYNLYCNLTFK